MIVDTPPAPPTSSTPPPPSPKPPRGPRVSLLAVLLILAVVSVAFGALASDWLKRGASKVTQLAAHDGHDHGQPTDGGDGGEGGYFTCGMHPWVILPAPGLCPICHMDLTPLDPAKLTGEIAINPVIVQNIGVRVAPVTTGPLVQEVRTVGSVAYDETSICVINVKFGGYVEELFVAAEGARVEAGQPLFTIYSPELYAAQEEYLLASRSGASSPQLLESARTRLRYFDLSDEQVAELERARRPTRALLVRSPFAGVVTEKMVNAGTRVEPGMPTYRVADLTRVWVDVTLYEYQLPFVGEGQEAAMTLPFVPGREFRGRVAQLYPYLSVESRQVRVRLEFANDDGRLKPGMFANVALRKTLEAEATLVPREAVLRTGSREIAFVSLGDGRFEPRTIRTGIETTGAQLQVLEGLREGDSVVTSGQFLLDSESKMRTALAKMVKGDLAGEAPTQEETAAEAAAPVAMADGYPLDTCVVTGLKLGSMGDPVVMQHEGRTVKFCCAGCPPKFRKEPAKYLAKLDAAVAQQREGHVH